MGEPQLERRRAVLLVGPHLRLEGRHQREQLLLPGAAHLAARHARHLARLDRQHQQPAHDERGLLPRPAHGPGEAAGARRRSPAAGSTTGSSTTSCRPAIRSRSSSRRRTRPGRRACSRTAPIRSARSARSTASTSTSACSARSGCCTSGRSSAAGRSRRSRSRTPRRTRSTGRRPSSRRRTWRGSSWRAPTRIYLKDAPGGAAHLTEDAATLQRGKVVFAERCARCHSSKLPPLPPGLDLENCNGPDYLGCWNSYWAWTKTDGFKTQMRQMVLADDFLKTTSSRPSCACRRRCCRPTSAARSRPTPSPATSGTTSRRSPTRSCRRSARSSCGIRSPARSTTTRCPAAAAASRGRRRSSASGRRRRSCRTTPSARSTRARRSRRGWASFQASIEQMLWPERREKDELFAKPTTGRASA